MQKAITMNSRSLKMSVCNEFVEHMWKPGFCKNCFHPRGDHRRSQALSEGRAGNLPVLQSLNGIRIKSENTHQDDDCVIAALYSKPTIAVKPTMITSDSAEVWEELNSTETLTQVSWKMSSSNSLLKQSGISRVIMDNFNKPFSHNYKSSNDSTNYLFTGLPSPDKAMEINAVHNLTYVSHFGGQADKGTFLKEKLPVSYNESTSVTKLNANGDIRKLTSIKEDCTLLSQKSSSGYSTSSRSSIDRPSPRRTLSGDNPSCQSNGTSSTGVCKQDTSTTAKDSKGKNYVRSSELGFSKNLNFGKIKVSLHSDSDGVSDTLSCNSIKDSPLTSPTNTDSQTAEFHSPTSYRSTVTKTTQQLTHSETHSQLQVEGSHSEPIYAESTKRKGAGLKIERNSTKPNNACEEKLHLLNSSKLYHESTTQVAAKITVMAAHTEDDNRTIYLSSPDSAVGVQWNCTSPSSTTENASLSPTFHWGERKQESKSEWKKFSISHKSQNNASPFVPPTITKPEECNGVSSPTRTTVSMCTTSQKKESLEVNDRCLPSLSVERKQKFYQWSKQCRIDEEEEEESFASPQPRLRSMSNGPLVVSSNASCNYDERTKLEELKPGKGMSKSVSCPVELAKANGEIENSCQPPPPPPKKLRHPLKMNKSNSELENASLGSVESLGESFKAMSVSNSNVNINVSFSTGSMDSLDSRTCSEGGQSYEAVNSPNRSPGAEKRLFHKVSSSLDCSDDAPRGSLQPPPLPAKKSMNRACSAPDNTAWSRAYPTKMGENPNGLRLNLSQSENNVFGEEATQPGYPLTPGDKPSISSSSESLEKCCRGNGHRNEIRNCLQSRGNLSASQLSVSSNVSCGSSLQLHHLLSNIDSKEGMYAKLSGLYAQSMRRLVNKCEDHFMREQKKELHFNENNWSLFKLTSNKPCCIAGDAIYYCATCATDPLNNYAIKMCIMEDTKSPPYCSLSLPVHFNIQQDCGNFLATVPFSMLQPSDPPKSSSANESSQSVVPAEQECVVVITREVPYRTTSDFVRESLSSHKTHPEVYERQVCLLLLQLCNGLEHLKEHGIIHRDLCLENLLLVHCQNLPDKAKDGKYLPRLIVSNFSKAKQRAGSEDSKPRRDKTRLAPEIMAASQYKKFDEFQTGILIYELLHQPNPFEVRTSLHEQEYSQKDLPPLPTLSVYSRGLQHLAHLLLEADPIKRIRIIEAKRILQCLLWGPRKDLTDQTFTHEEALHCALQNWIDMKRALLMMKFAERALEPNQSISLEDWLCCQYLASADPCYLYKTLKLIKLI